MLKLETIKRKRSYLATTTIAESSQIKATLSAQTPNESTFQQNSKSISPKGNFSGNSW